MTDYIKDNYGLCKKDKCHCLMVGWIGRRCEHWSSSNANSYEELTKWQKALKNEREILLLP